ncbi:MAG: GNAT family N-acetyltransferase [Gemmatimonadetes bacterium]|nr:GNAT family N-acetyltransferase [Gemmatimonadota bacterium]
MNIAQLDPADFTELADTLGDTPETVVAVHLLRKKLCKAFVAGSPTSFSAAIVQGYFDSEEPRGFGTEARALWELLQLVEGWDCIGVNRQCAKSLGDLIENSNGVKVRYYGDVYHSLTRPVRLFTSEYVRELTTQDRNLIASAPIEIQGGGYEDMETMLSEGIVAGAVDADQLVSIAHTSGVTDLHGEIGVGTLEPWRKMGLCSAAASIVSNRLQKEGRVPVWSTGEDNFASLRVAAKLGFQEVSRRTYVIPIKN